MSKKIGLIVAALVACVALAITWWNLGRRAEKHKHHPVRPDDFPEILIAPEGAQIYDHSTPSNTRRDTHSYTLTFIAEDPYPSTNTHEFIQQHLSSHGWQRLKYHLLNPDVPAKYHNPMWYALLKECNDVESYESEAKYFGIGTKDWVNDNDETICVNWMYKPLNDNQVDPNRVEFQIELYKRESWVKNWLLKYKKLHPEEFDKMRWPEE